MRSHVSRLLIISVAVLSGVAVLNPQSSLGQLSGSGPLAPAKDWTLVGGDWTNARHSTLSQINQQTIQHLGAAWVSKFDGGASSRATPVVHDGLMFITAGSRVYALNAKTGENVWNFQTELRPSEHVNALELQRAGLGIPNSQGVAVADGKVFVGLMDGNVIALDEKTGRSLWTRQVGDDPPLKKEGRWIGPAPTYAGGMVYVGLAADYGTRGQVAALDAETGKELWRFYTVPGPGEIGHDSWPQNNDAWKWGGGGVWQTGVIDPDLGLIYFSVGNPVPQYGGEPRPGNNLFTDSIIALDLKTGKLRWHYQVIHHDIWDADGAGPTPLILYDAQLNGRKNKAVAAMRSDGYLFLLDRATGKPILPVEERPVEQSSLQRTSPTQPFPVGADSVLPDCSTWKDKVPAGFALGCTYTPPVVEPANLIAPWFTVRVSPMSYSPETGYFYAQGIAELRWRRRTEDPYYFWFSGGSMPKTKSFGVLVAIDSRTDKIAWKKEFSRPGFGRGGWLSTAGGLVFRLGEDGHFAAYDALSGDVLWQFQTGSVNTAGSPASYEIDGEQYVAVSAGAAVWAFKLGGTLPPMPGPKASGQEDDVFVGPITDTNEVETATLLPDIQTTGRRYYVDQYTFNPYRVRIKPGTRMVWVNNGTLAHTIIAQDGSWTTGPIRPGGMGFATFDKPGKYAYICKDHPWSYGQILVERISQTQKEQAGLYTSEQAARGKAQYSQSCSGCHGEGLEGVRGPALVGDAFLRGWGGQTVADLLERIRSTMPQGNPGSLSSAAYLDVVAFLLQANSFPAGAEPLKDNTSQLKVIKMGQK